MIGFIVLIGIEWEYHVNISAVYHWNKEHIYNETQSWNEEFWVPDFYWKWITWGFIPTSPGWDLLHHVRTVSDWTILEIHMGMDQNLL